ncbi:methyltransferase domain-containing protein [Paenibacillus thiaminolyticus]|nr:methyltransferase domain-containing protein [Paenibacillus thiaminolyticus]
MTLEHIPINSKQYWDDRFNSDWEGNSGRQQTLYFCNIAESMFPDWFVSLLLKGASFADVGCAEGDGTNFFAERYPNSKFTGLDFSEAAINKAKKHYPKQNFIQAEVQNINSKFDIVFSSNTLEHFINPFEILNHLFRITNKYTVILIPFQEYERFKEHFYTFDYKDFDINYSNFSIVYAHEFDCGKEPNIYWAGKQLLVIYAHKDVLLEHKCTLHDYINSLSMNYSEMKIDRDKAQNQLEEMNLLIKSQQETIFNQTKLIEQIYRDKEQLHSERDLLKKDKEIALTENEKLQIKLEATRRELDDLLTPYRQMEEQFKDLKSAFMLSHEAEKTLEKEIDYLKKQLEWLLSEKYSADVELQSIKSSTLWAVGSKYYYLRDNTPIVKEAYKGLRIWKRYGFRTLVKKIYSKVKLKKDRMSLNVSLQSVYSDISKKFEQKDVDGIVIIPSAFEFKELYNQRTINLAKYLSKNNKAVLFVVWQWAKGEEINKNLREVHSNVFQIALYDFIESMHLLDAFENVKYKKAILNIPSKKWNEVMFNLKVKHFEIIYDIMDDWEEFQRVGQASWYQQESEESVILNADRVYAVSSALVEKFLYLRKDITCIGNGYYPDLLGIDKRDIATRTRNKTENVKLGYFGHLTESWFDWELVEEILSKDNFIVEVIGYGVSEEKLSQLKKYDNFNYVGTVEPNQLYKYVEEWDIGLIPFIESNLSVAVDPIKVYEYLYFGLKVVVTGIPHLQSYPNVYYYDQGNESLTIASFIEKVYAAEVSESLEMKLNEFLEKTLWDNRFEQLLNNPINCYSEIYKYESN